MGHFFLFSKIAALLTLIMALIPLPKSTTPNSNVWISGILFQPADSDLLLNYLMPHLGHGHWKVPAGRPRVIDAISPVDVEGDDDPQEWYNEHLKPFQDTAYFFRTLTRYYGSDGCQLKFRRRVGNQLHPKWGSRYPPVPIYDEDKNLLGYKQGFRYENPHRRDHLLWNLTEYKTIDVNQWERVVCKLEKNTKKHARTVAADASATGNGPKPSRMVTADASATGVGPKPARTVTGDGPKPSRTVTADASATGDGPKPAGNVRTPAVNADLPDPAPTSAALNPTTQRNRWRRICRTVLNLMIGEPTAGVQAGPAISNTANPRRRQREENTTADDLEGWQSCFDGEIVDLSDG